MFADVIIIDWLKCTYGLPGGGKILKKFYLKISHEFLNIYIVLFLFFLQNKALRKIKLK